MTRETATADRTPDATAESRGRRLYDRWSEHGLLYSALMRMAAPLRRDAFAALDAAPGETVLDLGCGPGLNFDPLRSAVGPDGAVVGLDYSEGMVETATERVRERGWENVSVVRGDATRTCVDPGGFDAVLTTFALHTMEDAEAVVRNVREALRPGGRFVALDAREFTSWPGRALNPAYSRLVARLVNHQPDEDPLAAVRATFDDVDVVETYDGGSGYLVVARKESGDAD